MIAFPAQRRIPLRRFLTNLVKGQSGVTAIEYALIAALIAVAAIAAFTLVGTNLSTTDTLYTQTPGQYEVQVTEQFGCSSSWSAVSAKALPISACPNS